MDGQQIGRYRIDGTLGSGAMGVVYRAFDTQIQRPVALKTIRKELMVDEQRESMMARFRNEVIAAGRMVHPNIVTVFDFGEDPDSAFIAMELVEGKALNRLISKGQRVDRGLVVSWVSQLLNALEYAHGMNIIHRDIKPGNLLITPQQQLKITDFGVAKIDTTTMTQMGSIVGTPSYMSPEQFRGEAVDRRADVFSAAIILYQLLTGARPFQGSPTAVMHSIMNLTPERPSEACPDIPAPYDEVVMRGLEKDPAKRFASAREFRKALQAAFQLDTVAVDAQLAGAEDEDPADTSADATQVPMLRPARELPSQSGSAARSGGPGTHGGSASGIATSHWDPGFLSDVEASLKSHLGPVASLLVRKAAGSCHDMDQLSAKILDNVGSASARTSVHQMLQSLAVKHAPKLGASASHSGNGAGSAPGQPATGSGIGPNQLLEVERLLIPTLGPIANALVKRTAARANGAHQFYAMLAEHIPDQVKRARFLRDVGMG